MKILMLITGMQSGGAERVMATLCNGLARDHSVRLGILKTAKSDYQLSDRVEIAAGNILNRSLLTSVNFVKNEIDNWKPNVVMSFMTKTNIILKQNC